MARAICTAFGMPAPFLPWIAALATRPRWGPYTAPEGDQIAGGGYLHTGGREAWLGVGGVLAQYCGRGASMSPSRFAQSSAVSKIRSFAAWCARMPALLPRRKNASTPLPSARLASAESLLFVHPPLKMQGC